MPTKLYDDEDTSIRSGSSLNGSHDDLGVSEDERQKEIDELERLYRGEEVPKEKELSADGISDAEDAEVSNTDDDAEDPERSSLARQTEIDSDDRNYFVPDTKSSGGGLLKNAAKKRAAIIASTGILGLFLSLGGFLGFLNTFRLKHLVENINFQAFSRYNAAVDRRSDRWVRTYFKLRMMEWEGQANPDGDGNVYFRANRVDTNNPVRDWYRTMRTSRFEADLLKTSGIQFTSVIGPDGKVRAGKIDISGRTVDIVPDGANNFTVIDDLLGDSNKFNALASQIDGATLDIFENDKAARRAIKEAVNKNTSKWEVIKRRHIRKSIANMTGVRDWRFFDKTRTRVEDKRAEFKRKMIKKVFPANDSRSGNFLMCILGLGSCVSTTDPANPDNIRGAGSASANGNPEGDPVENSDGTTQVDKDGNPIRETIDPSDIEGSNKLGREGLEELVEEVPTEAGFMKGFLKKITQQFAQYGGGPMAVKKILDWAVKFENNLSTDTPSGRSKIGDAIYMARISGSLMLAYATISTITDQMQSGEVDPDQVNAAMQYFDGASNSEGFSVVFEGKEFGDNVLQTKANGEKVNKCETGEPFDSDDLVPFCENFRPNGGSRVSGLEDAWTKYVSNSPLGAIIDGYKSFKDSFFGSLLDKVGDFIGSTVATIINPIFTALGITNVIENVASWLSERVLSWVGVKPCITGAEDTGGMAVNCLVGGAAATAETAARSAGGFLVNFDDTAYKYSEKLAAEFTQESYDSMGVYDRYFAFNNHQSLASSLLFGITLNKNMSSFLSTALSLKENTSKIGSAFEYLFNGQAKAQQAEPINLAQFSGVDTYVIPKECVEDLEPLDPDYYLKATNNPSIEKTKQTLSSTDAFSAALYSKNGDSLNASDIENIYNTYNCAAFDNVVTDGLGYMYGYDSGDGYTSSGADLADSNSGAPVGSFIAGSDPGAVSNPNEPCYTSATSREGFVADGWKNGSGPIPIKLCIVHGFAINASMAQNFDEMFTAMKVAGFSLPGANQGNFRSYETQASMYSRNPNGAAKPGFSNHQFGLAIDIRCANSDGSQEFGAWMPGKDRGLPAFQRAINEHPCLKWLSDNSFNYGLLLQCRGRGRGGGEIAANTGGCETWHLSPTGG